jgi:hypothetical protein
MNEPLTVVAVLVAISVAWVLYSLDRCHSAGGEIVVVRAVAHCVVR